MLMNNYNQAGLPFEPYGGNNLMMQNNMMQRPMQPQQPMMQPPKIDPRMFETPQIVVNENQKPMFSVVPDNDISSPGAIKVDREESDMEKRSRKLKERGGKKELSSKSDNIVKVEKSADNGDVIEDPATIYSYMQTTNLLHETLGQIDAVNSELVKEFEAVKNSRTMKNKYMVLTNLSENIGSLLNNRISAIKEINNCISKANEMDYKKYKDVKAAQSAMTDDKYIADLYKAFIQNPGNRPTNIEMVNPVDPSIYGSGIVRANITDTQAVSGEPVDAGYLSYLANLTPEQNMMRYENDPNVKQVVVYDASTGNKFFQVMNVATGEVIPNVPVYDQMFMEDTTLDLKTKIAKNINMNEQFPIVVINDNITSQY